MYLKSHKIINIFKKKKENSKYVSLENFSSHPWFGFFFGSLKENHERKKNEKNITTLILNYIFLEMKKKYPFAYKNHFIFFFSNILNFILKLAKQLHLRIVYFLHFLASVLAQSSSTYNSAWFLNQIANSNENKGISARERKKYIDFQMENNTQFDFTFKIRFLKWLWLCDELHNSKYQIEFERIFSRMKSKASDDACQLILLLSSSEHLCFIFPNFIQLKIYYWYFNEWFRRSNSLVFRS